MRLLRLLVGIFNGLFELVACLLMLNTHLLEIFFLRVDGRRVVFDDGRVAPAENPCDHDTHSRQNGV